MKKRIIVFSFAMLFLFSIVLGRLGYIAFNGDYKVSATHNSYTVDVDKVYETVYDRNLSRITNKTVDLAAVIRPSEKCLTEMNKLFSYKEREEIMAELKQGYPVIRQTDNYVSCKYIKIFETTNRHSEDMLAKHLVLSAESLIPNVAGSKSINFSVDAIGRLLDGDEGRIIEDNYNSKKGLALTIDSKVQKVAEDAGNELESGAVVVLDVKTGNVLAAYSTPDSYINRAFSSYCVGSVYKLVVAACAIENNIDDSFECTGEITVGDTTFSCQQNTAHGEQHIKEALANSCNCYFIQLALKLGAEKITEISERFGFGSVNNLFDGWSVSSGNMPSVDDLQSKGQLALLGFGQGMLTDSPLHFASVVAAIANGGVYNKPEAVLGTVDDDGNLNEKEKTNAYRVISEKTAQTLCDYMRYVVCDGSGRRSDYNDFSAGKTSTAQSGRYIDNEEILYTWFAGFYPYGKPQYAIVVMKENGLSGAKDCCPVFRTIVENLDE